MRRRSFTTYWRQERHDANMPDEITVDQASTADTQANTPDTTVATLGVGTPINVVPEMVPAFTVTTGGATSAATTSNAVQVHTDDTQAQIKALRDEAAKWRTQLRDAQQQIKDLQTQATGNDDLAKKLATLEANLASETAKAERASKEATLFRVATKAGVDPDVAALLDLSKLNLEDEAEAVKQLAKLAPAKVTGTQVKPAQGATGASTQALDEAAMRTRFFGGPGGVTLFGG